MSNNLRKAGEAILKMGYYKNQNARSGSYNPGHEEAVAVVLEEHGFKRFTQKDFPHLKRSMLKRWWDSRFTDTAELEDVLNTMPVSSFILQPGGSQSFPDLLIRDTNRRFVALECKSGKGYHPMWNDSTAKHGAVYIMSSEKVNESTMFMGEDVITQDELDVISHYHKLFNDLKNQCQDAMSKVFSMKRGWYYSHRQQFFQIGGAEYTNYFTHKDRKMCEQNVLTFLGE